MSAHDQMKMLLDQLMGTSRNGKSTFPSSIGNVTYQNGVQFLMLDTLYLGFNSCFVLYICMSCACI